MIVSLIRLRRHHRSNSDRPAIDIQESTKGHSIEGSKSKFYLSNIGDLVHRFPVEGFVRFGDTREIVECGFEDRLVELHSTSARLRVQIDEQSFTDFLIARLNQIAETCGIVTLKLDTDQQCRDLLSEYYCWHSKDELLFEFELIFVLLFLRRRARRHLKRDSLFIALAGLFSGKTRLIRK